MPATEDTARRAIPRALRHMVMAATGDIDPKHTSALYLLLHRREFTEVAFELALAAASGRTVLSETDLDVLRPLVAAKEVPAAVLAQVRPHDDHTLATWVAPRTNGLDEVDLAAVITAASMPPLRRVRAGRRITRHTGADLGPAYLIDFAEGTPEHTVAGLTHEMCVTLCRRTTQNFSICGRPEHDGLCGYHRRLATVGDVLWERGQAGVLGTAG